MWFEVEGLHVGYGAVPVLRDVALSVERGELVAVIGPNGAGKTTLLRALSGLVPIQSGRVTLNGERMDGRPAHKIVALGIGHAPEGGKLFRDMTVKDNLLVGAYLHDRQASAAELATAYSTFPKLRTLARQKAGSLSGGEQQMLAIARALMSGPRLLLLDEPSIGLAPLIVAEISALIKRMSAEGEVGIILVEQNAQLALSLASRAYVLELGAITLTGPSEKLIDDPGVREAYLSA